MGTFDLQRFIDAQNTIYAQVCAELRAGRKHSHWMWFIFPQIEGLGHSAMAHRYAIASLAEARAYLAHAQLGARLRECTQLVAAIEDSSIDDIFGSPDNMKFHSSMTLFDVAASDVEDKALFRGCLLKYFGGRTDPLTLTLLATA